MNDSVDFQIVTEGVASMLEPHARVIGFVSPYWNFIVVLLAMLLMVVNKHLYSLRFRMMLSVLTQPADTDKMTREWNPIVSVNGFTIFIAYIAMMALLVQKIVLIYSGNTILYSSFSFYIDVCVFITALCVIQYLVITLYGWLFNIQSATTHQEVTHLSSMAILNIVMIPLLLIIIFYPIKIVLIITISIILIIIGIRIIKTFFEFQILSRMNLLNNFLYFCTLEIIPLSVAITMMRRLIVTDCVL